MDALEFDSPDYMTRYDREAGRLVMVEESVLRSVEEGDEEGLAAVPEWQKEQVEIARAMVADTGERFIDPPDKFEFHEYRQMERFIVSLEEATAAEQLWRAIKGKGAFRYFKDTLHRLGLQDQWYRYREKAMKEFVIEGQKKVMMGSNNYLGQPLASAGDSAAAIHDSPRYARTGPAQRIRLPRPARIPGTDRGGQPSASAARGTQDAGVRHRAG